MQLIKRILGSMIQNSKLLRRAYTIYAALYNQKTSSKIKEMFRYHVVLAKRTDSPEDSYEKQFHEILRKIKVDTASCFYIYPFDKYVVREIPRGFTQLGSMTVDFSRVLKGSLRDIEEELQKDSILYYSVEKRIIRDIKSLIDRLKKDCEKDTGNVRRSFFITALSNMVSKPCESFDECLQRILFYDALFWQMNHRHIGLGRLDLVLYPFYKKEVDSGSLDSKYAKQLLKEFILTLNRDMLAKSMSIAGDTGQYILIGGQGENGLNVDNEITEMILDIFSDYCRPDPKLILRVNSQTKNEIWKKASDCLVHGTGSPLLMNEDLIKNQMIHFGYKEEDVWNVGTSACWEPLIIGKSFDQNNPFPAFVLLSPLNDLLSHKENFNKISSFSVLFNKYIELLDKYTHDLIHDILFDVSPLFSLFYDYCNCRSLDFTKGGAVYNYHGIQMVGLPNLINALLNLKIFVFDNKQLTLDQCHDIILANYEGKEDVLMMLQKQEKRFGKSDKEVVDITNEVMAKVSDIVSKVSVNGEKVKVGFSSPSYIVSSKSFPASIDGRKAGEPFAVHLSPTSASIDLPEILDFTSQLHYFPNILNGNVTDFTIPPAFAQNTDKLASLLKFACIKGCSQIQLNVLNKKVLIDAKAHPEKYTDLVVRVWGFSAYFNDLPEEYKDNLIKRASLYEPPATNN